MECLVAARTLSTFRLVYSSCPRRLASPVDHVRYVSRHVEEIVGEGRRVLVTSLGNDLVHAYVEILRLLKGWMVLELLILLARRGSRARCHWTQAHSMAIRLRKLLLWMSHRLTRVVLGARVRRGSSYTLVRSMTRSTPRVVRDLVALTRSSL